MSTCESPRLPLKVYVVWHPRFSRGAELADGLYRHLSNDPERPAARRIGIPIRFRSVGIGGAAVPAAIELDSEYSGIVVLIDDEMVADETFGPYIGEVLHRCTNNRNRKHRVYPVAVTSYASKLHPDIGKIQSIRLESVAEPAQLQLLLNAITHELARLLLNQSRAGDPAAVHPAGPAPVRVFLSHAKKDGLDLATAVRSYISMNSQMETFFDAHEIPPASEWQRVIEQEVSDSRNALLVLQTDAYSSREWCRIEALRGKLAWLPILVVQANERHEPRGFPYLGNGPTIRWPVPNAADPWAEILGHLLYEVLRACHFKKHIEWLKKLYRIERPLKPIAYPPELLTLLPMERAARHEPGTIFVYPDPPLGTEERVLLQEAGRGLTIITPVELPALMA